MMGRSRARANSTPHGTPRPNAGSQTCVPVIPPHCSPRDLSQIARPQLEMDHLPPLNNVAAQVNHVHVRVTRNPYDYGGVEPLRFGRRAFLLSSLGNDGHEKVKWHELRCVSHLRRDAQSDNCTLLGATCVIDRASTTICRPPPGAS